MVFLCVAGIALAQGPAYWQPAISGRGALPNLGSFEGAPRVRGYAFINGVYGSDLAQPASGGATIAGSDTPLDTAQGAEVGGGASGYYHWQRTTLGIDYSGSYRRYVPRRVNDGAEHLLNLGLSHDLNSRWTLSLAESGGIFIRQVLYNPFNLLDPAMANAPHNDVFDDRTRFLASIAQITYHKSPRLSFNMGGRGYVVRRDSSDLVGLSVYQGDAGLGYALTATKTVGLDYSFARYTYTRVTGSALMQAAGLSYTQHLGPHWEAALRLGGYRTGREALTRNQPSSTIGQIIGPGALVSTREVRYLPSFEARLKRQLRHGSAMVAYTRGIDPGNGIYLLSERQAVDVGYRYRGFRRWDMGVDGGYGIYKSLAEVVSPYRGFRMGGGATYRVFQIMHLVARFDYSQFEVRATNFLKERYRVSFGVGFAPKEMSLPTP
jgi:hypothetical protein